jgi:hypothetical protein
MSGYDSKKFSREFSKRTIYSEALVRRLIERITVFDEMLEIEFKSGLEIEVEV